MDENHESKSMDENRIDARPTKYDDPKTDNGGLPAVEQKPLGINGKKILDELLVEIALMYTYARNARTSIPENLISDISRLLSDTVEEMKEEKR